MTNWITRYCELKRLSCFYNSMIKINVHQAVFEHVYNDVLSHVILDIDRDDGWDLIFVKHGIGDVLKMKVKIGYRVYVDRKLFNNICEYFGIKGAGRKFSIKEFFLKVDSQIPDMYVLDDKSRHNLYENYYKNRDGEGEYPIGLVSWSQANAKRGQKLNIEGRKILTKQGIYILNYTR